MSIITKDDEIALQVQEDPTPGVQLLTTKERKRNIAFLTGTALFSSAANSIHFIFYSLFFLEIRNSEKLFGIVATIASLVAIIGLIVSDYLNGILGYKRVLIIADILIAFAFVFFTFQHNIIWLIIGAIMILNFAYSLGESPTNIILAETAGEGKKGKIISLIAFFGRFGEVIVSALIFIILFVLKMGYTNSQRSWYYLYSSISIAVIAIGIFIVITDPSRKLNQLKKKASVDGFDFEELPQLKTIREKKMEIEELPQKSQPSFIRSFIDTFKDKWVFRVAITFFMDAFLWSIALGVHWPGLIDEDLFGLYALKDVNVSLLIMITSITVFATMFLGRLVDKAGARFFLFLSEICGLVWAVLIVIYTFYPSNFWLLIIARITIGISVALWIPSTITLFTNVESKRKSKVYNSIAIFRSIGWLPGGFIAGFLYEGIAQPYGFLTPLFILIGGMFILIPLFFTLPNRPSDMNKNNKTVKK